MFSVVAKIKYRTPLDKDDARAAEKGVVVRDALVSLGHVTRQVEMAGRRSATASIKGS
jgi:hypothetical protein